MAGLKTHYLAHGIEKRILAALRTAGLDPDKRLSPLELAALDHFHTGGFRASLVLKELVKIRTADRQNMARPACAPRDGSTPKCGRGTPPGHKPIVTGRA